jgi:hypothetical protein
VMYIHSSYVLLFKKKACTRNRKKVRTKFVGMHPHISTAKTLRQLYFPDNTTA